MKKLIAFIISFSLVLLCACSGNETSGDNYPKETVALTEHPNSFGEWGTDLLPEGFPSPVKGMHDLKIESGEPSKDTYRTNWVRLTFTCFEKNIYDFSNSLTSSGYIGGIKNIHAPTGYYYEGFNGAWQNGKNIVRVNSSKTLDSGEVEFVFDILECRDSFPAELEEKFPRFDGYAISTGKYYLYDENKTEVISRKFGGVLSDNSWYWDFGYEDAFIGVTMDEISAYENKLVKAGFGGECSTSVVDGCTVISYDLYKTVGENRYAVFVAYNQILKTLDIVYTNDASLFTGT